MVGTWKAHSQPITPPAGLVDEQTRKNEEEAARLLNSVTIEFKLNGDGTCSMNMDGLKLPGVSAPTPKPTEVPGTWTLTGNKLNLDFHTTRNKIALVFTVSPDGRSFKGGNRGATFTKE